MRKTANPIQVVICAYPQFIGDYNKAAEKKIVNDVMVLELEIHTQSVFQLRSTEFPLGKFHESFRFSFVGMRT